MKYNLKASTLLQGNRGLIRSIAKRTPDPRYPKSEEDVKRYGYSVTVVIMDSNEGENLGERVFLKLSDITGLEVKQEIDFSKLEIKGEKTALWGKYSDRLSVKGEKIIAR